MKQNVWQTLMIMRGLNTKKAITGVGITVGVLIGGFSYHEYKVISDENDKLTDKVHSQGTQIFEQNDLLMKNDQYISELESKNDEMVSKNNKLKKDKATLEKEKAKVKSELDKQNKTVKKLQKRINTLEAAEVSPTVSSTKTVSKKIPQDKVKVSGTSLGKYLITGYTNGHESTGKSPGHPAYGITASGNKTQEGITVSCPPEMELGTMVHIEGIGERRCDDRGGAIKGRHLDLYIANLNAAQQFGKQYREVKVIN